jgi:spermidine/putrescine transport system permease protein
VKNKGIRKFKSKIIFLLLPYLFLSFLLIVVPLLLVLFSIFFEFSTKNYLKFSFSKFFSFLSNEKELVYVFFISFFYSFIATFSTIIIVYPAAYLISFINKNFSKNLIYVLIGAPMWINFLLRTIGVEVFFRKIDYLFNTNIFLGSETGVIIAMIWLFLPLMLLPITNSLNNIDRNLIEASKDLGASNFYTFRKIILPHSMKGIMTGIILMFPNCMGSLVITKYIGKGKVNLIGNIIENYFYQNLNFDKIIIISLILMLILLLIILILNKITKRSFEKKKSNNEIIKQFF